MNVEFFGLVLSASSLFAEVLVYEFPVYVWLIYLGPSAPETVNVTVTSPTEILVHWERPGTIYKRIDKYVIRIRSVSGEVLEEKESYGDNTEVLYSLYLLSCQPAKTDSGVMFCLQSFQELRTDSSLVY